MAHEWSHNESVSRLIETGISFQDALTLRRIAMTLARWHELECGDSNNYTSWCIARGRWSKANGFEYDDNGDTYMERHIHADPTAKAHYHRIPDRERGALKRLAKIMQNYPLQQFYVQTDPRGAALYISRPGEALSDQNYNRGIAVYK